MKIRKLAVVAGTLSLVLLSVGSTAAKEPLEPSPDQLLSHDLTAPQIEKQRAERASGRELLLTGQVQAHSDDGDQVVRLRKGQYVELAREGEDTILTVLGEFGTAPATDHPATHGAHGGTPGPLRNQIPKPNRRVDNSTIWVKDFSEAYYEDLLFSEKRGAVSMRNYYIEQSSGRYAVNGDVSPWVQVPNNAASYGSNYCGDIVCADTWRFVNDSVDAFAASFPSAAALNAYLAPYDVWDRYDADGDGDFDEPDGYIDHFQSVHAGEGEETGGGAQGEDAIWSHRWYAYFGANGPDGPGVNTGGIDYGGVRIGGSNYWIGDYTVEPENGGVGVFAHEFAHDLGLPDLYDTSGNTGGAENSTGFWTLMSSGSYGNSGRAKDGIGTKPVHMGNWEKFQVGWLNYEVAFADDRSTHRIGPSEYNTAEAQGVFVVLPERVVPLELGAPCAGCGTQYFYSGAGDNLNNTMTRSVASGGPLTAQVRYDTEENWDFAFLDTSADGGATWTSVPTNQSDSAADDLSGINASGTGMSGSTAGAWTALTATLPAGTNTIRFRYTTDGALTLPGFQVDDIRIGGTVVGTAESGEIGWTLVGFSATTGSETLSFFNAYVLENRQYLGFDKSLKTGPYNFGYATDRPNKVEHFEYQDGLLISYWNSQYTDNNVGDHPGEGLVLPIDAHPRFSQWRDGTLMRPRILAFDSTFGLDRVPKLRLHNDGVAATIASKPAVPVFNDSRDYWSNCDQHACTGDHAGRYQPGWYGVDTPDTGTTIRVRSVNRNGIMRVDIR